MSTEIQKFITTVRKYYQTYGRDLPWRHDPSPYEVFVSEIMLQQTQVSRVLKKYPEFLAAFPDFRSLADADLSAVLRIWQGMGYNRRAKFLHESSKIITNQYGGTLPKDEKTLVGLPGVGLATAGSLACFAYDIPTVFIETNVRRVFIFHFFADRADKVSDSEIIPLLKQTVPDEKPREWYWALMDYGSYLATVVDNPNTKSKHYTKQSKFVGSDRQIRGRLLREYLSSNMKPILADDREEKIWEDLQKEKLVIYD